MEVPDSTCFMLHKSFSEYDSSYRPPMAACFINKIINAIPPRCDTTDPVTLLDGIGKRMAYSPPRYNRRERRNFRKFVRKWLKQNLTPIDENDDLDFEQWLNETNYPDWRKEQIRKSYPEGCFVNGEVDTKKFKNYDVKIFTKEEYYPEYKHARGIWARSDEAKCILGPFFRKIEKQLFSLPYFIKKVPKHERPEYIDKFMNNAFLKFQNTDYTSYESLFTTDLMDDCEFELYRFMSSKNIKAKMLCRLIFKILASTNIARNKYFSVKVDAKRMSGEMNTSLGNGFSNLMILLYACEKYKLNYSGPIVEGDDASIGLNEAIPDIFYKDMGLNVKLELVDSISEGSFCGLVYDEIDLVNIREPFEPLCTTPWITRKYAGCKKKKYYSLLRSKALSLMFEYPGCPIVYNYGKKIFDLLHKFEIKFEKSNSYQENINNIAYNAYIKNKLPYKITGLRTRLLMEKIFKVTVSDQLRIESEIENITLDDFNIPSVLELLPDIWKINYQDYVLHSTNQNWNSITHPCRLRYDKLNIHRISFLTKEEFKKFKNAPLTKEKFYEYKLNKDDKLYVHYLEKYNDALHRLKINNMKI